MVDAMRQRVLREGGGEILVSRLEGSMQQADLSAPTNAGGLGRRRHFRRRVAEGWPDNFLPIVPASRWLRISPPAVMHAEVFQLAACAWRCWYCFVPFPLLAGDERKGRWASAAELVDLYAAVEDRPPILDLSGGSPDLAPEWVAWTMDAVEARGIGKSTYLWSDDNLSSDHLLRPDGSTLLRRMERYGAGYGKVCCLKGFDAESFSFNTQAEPDGFERQLRILVGYSRTDLDLYLYVTLTSPRTTGDDGRVRELVARLADIRSDLPRRTVPLLVTEFSAMRSRIDAVRRDAMENQWRLVEAWTDAVSSLEGGPE
ncbi:hypothetical protein [Aureimonas jatrophae]|nr:hypothetical protein [Aureimonas jatrophae]